MATKSNASYLEDISLSPYLKDRTKTTYRNALLKIMTLTGEKSLHKLLHDPQKYAPLLQARVSTEETHKAYLIAILAIIKYSDLKETNHPLFNGWYKHYLQARRVVNKRLIKNIPTDRQIEAHVDWEVIKKKAKEVGEKAPGSKEHVLMGLLTILPPRRQTDWFQVRIYDDKDPMFKPKADHNYINLGYHNQPYGPYILLIDYKTSKFYGNWYKLVPKKLHDLLNLSLELHPRDYLFVDRSGKPYDRVETFTKWSNGALKRIFENDKVSMNSIRHSFTTWFKKKWASATAEEIMKVSRDMGHNMQQNAAYNLKGI
jgi:hypothetical protein